MADDKLFHSFKITGDPKSIYKKILLDGKEMKGIRSAAVMYEVDNIPRVFLEMQTTDIEIDEPHIAVLPCPEEAKTDDH